MRLLPVDDSLSLRGETLQEAINKDREDGLLPFYVRSFISNAQAHGHTFTSDITGLSYLLLIISALYSCHIYILLLCMMPCDVLKFYISKHK